MGVAMSQSSVSYLWREPDAAKNFKTGVSLHSHTNQSKETLDFISELSKDWGILQPVMRWCEARSHRLSGIQPDYARSYWTPPLTPSLAFDLERRQIEEKLQLPGLVSITDHDDINAPLLLRSLPSARHIPVSVEWTVPFGTTAFHLGIHNLPSATGVAWMERMREFTAIPVETRAPELLRDMLAELDELPSVLVIFNHPIWDLYRVGKDRHEVFVNEFLARHGQHVHALELNGLRNWKENREAATLASKWNQLVISGGDRHGVEPNANVNLTRAESFTEFVHEVRRERQSHVLFMPQYAEPWKHRILQSTLDAIRDYPHFPEGSRRWDQRVYHPDRKGDMQPLSELWNRGRSPRFVRGVLAAVRMMGAAPLSRGLRLAWNESGEMRTTLSRQEA
ncbi:hypothetical protein EDE15_2857 [Edaphobacter aggregans]|uniref:Uncharacterized protein n=1 Tax=Edaphobacter aggregans TaxID=570835 RepID=A0A3R9PAH7_9BACT|nr:hypothetical protein [Edaphobacter aggregans]RSL17327.1 hypothetical protein EDE15_2857 [Edaphobacter aggregans]